MESYDTPGHEPRDKVTAGGEAHLQNKDSNEEFLDYKRRCVSAENSLQSVVTEPGNADYNSSDVSNSSTLPTSTGVSSNVSMNEMNSSINTAELRENYDIGNHDATRPSYDGKDGEEYLAAETAEKRRDELKDGAEHDAGNGIVDKAKREARDDGDEIIREAREAILDIVRAEAEGEAIEIDLKTMNGSKDIVRDVAKNEAIEEAGDENRELVKSEAKSETCEEARDEAKGLVREFSEEARDEAKGLVSEFSEEARDEVKGLVREFSEEVRDEAKGLVREFSEEARDEVKGLVREFSEEARAETKDIVRDNAKSEVTEVAKALVREFSEEASDEIKHVVREKANSEAIEVAKALVREFSEEARDENQGTVRDNANHEANEAARDENRELVRNETKYGASEEAIDDTKGAVRDNANSEAMEEAGDETRDLVRIDAKSKGTKKVPVDTNDEPVDNHEALDKASVGTRMLTHDGNRNEDMDGVDYDVSHVASDEETGPIETEPDQNEDDVAISIKEDIWRYILKTPEWTRRISRLKEELDVEVEESTSDGGMRLRIFGVDRSNADRAKMEVLNLVFDCQDVVHTNLVPCHDNHVHSKVVRLLKAINKLPCYVSAAPSLIRVTGTSEEIRSCLEKLEAYGVRCEPERRDTATEKKDFKEQQTPLVKQTSLEKLKETPLEKPSPAPLKNSHQGNLSRELPVPIERHLWHFIQEKRRSDLRGLEEGFGVTISTKPTNDVTTVAVCISALLSDSVQFLDFAEQALAQLLEGLGLQVVVKCVLEGEGVAKITQERLNSLQQELAGIDVIFEVIDSRSKQNPGYRLLIIGPEKELVLSREVICRALGNMMGSNTQSSFFDDPKTSRGMSNVDQNFPGAGHRLGVKMSKSPEEGRQSYRGNARDGYADPTPATGGPFQDHPSESKLTSDRSMGQHSSNGCLSEPKCSRRTPSEMPEPSLSQTKEAVTSTDPSIVDKNSSERRSERLVTDKIAKENKVPFADPTDGIRVYPSEPSPSYDLLDIDKPVNESDTTKCPEPKGTCNPMNTATRSRNETGVADSTAGRLSLCSTCKNVPETQRMNGCDHVLCLACIMNYMGHSDICCPICGNSGRPNVAPTQPIGGQMLVTHNNACRLPGFENNSKGIIIITYVFKQGHQTSDCPSPGQPYPGLTKTAFLPLSPIGNEVLDLFQKAFEARLTFRIAFSPNHPSGELVWNEILHKENMFGGPKEGGYPDPAYMERVRQDLLAKGIH